MNLFNLLKNKAGKMVLGTSQIVVLSIGAGGLLASGAFKTGEALGEKELAVRSLSSVSSRYSYEGLAQRDGMLTSMNIQNREGRKGVAVGQDRARLEGTNSKNDFGLTAIDNLDRTVTVSGPGAAAATSATEGLGSGGVDMVEVGGGNTAVRASAPRVNAPTVSQGAAGTASSAAGGQLASASMARASGNAFTAASGAMGGSGAGNSSGSRGGASSHSSGSDGYQFSGAMPNGSNVVSAHVGAAGGRGGTSQFLAGGRNSTVHKGSRSLKDKNNDLSFISKRSADIAKNAHRSANAGARAFLDSSQNSGGLSIEGGEETAATGSADFSTPTDRNLKKIGDWGDRESEKDKERAKDRNNLAKLLMWSFFATIVAIPLGYMLISAGKNAGVWGVVKIIAGCAVLAAAIGVAIALCVAAGKYAHDWEGGLLSTLSGIFGGVSIVALALTVGAAFAGTESPLRTKFFDKIMPTAKTLAIGQVVSKGGELAKNEISKGIQNESVKKSKK